MKHKVILISTMTFVVLFVAISSIVFNIQMKGFEKEIKTMDFGMDLMKEGNYEEGLEKCFSNKYQETAKTICTSVLISLKMGTNESLTQEDCDSVYISQNPTKEFPFTVKVYMELEGKNDGFKKFSSNVRAECDGYVRGLANR